jgi:hypothetical protein
MLVRQTLVCTSPKAGRLAILRGVLVVCSWCARGVLVVRVVCSCVLTGCLVCARAAFVACSLYARVSSGLTLLTPIPYCDC